MGPGVGRGCAEEDEEEDARCQGAVPGASLGSRTGGSPQQGGSPAFPASPALVRDRGPAEGTLGKREADAQVLPLKPEFLLQAAESPRRQRGGRGWSLRGRGGCGEPWELPPWEPAWRHCPRPLGQDGASRGAAALLASPAREQSWHTPRRSGGTPKGWSRQPQHQAAPQNLQVGADPHSIAGSISVPKHGHVTPLSVLPRKSSPGRSRGEGGVPVAAAALLTSSGSGRWRTRSWPPRGTGLVAWAPC